MTIDKVKKLVSEQLNIPVEKIADNSKIIDDLGADSLDIVEMLMTFEDEFDLVSIPDEDAITLKTIKDVANYIDQKNN